MTLSPSLPNIENRIFLKGEYQAAVVYLGQLAFSDLPAAVLAIQAGAMMSQVLQVENSLVWELTDDSQSLYLLAGSGEEESSPVCTPILLPPNSLAEEKLSSPYPILVEKGNANTPVGVSGLVADQGIKNGLSVRIGTIEKPYGIIQVFSEQGQFFSQSDIYFLQSIANILGLAIRRERCQQEPAARRVENSMAKSTVQPGHLEWDRIEIKNRLVEGLERERLRLAQDLHDVPIQDLYGMLYQLDDLRETLIDPESKRLLAECDHTLHRVINSLRTICRDLRPPSLSPFGLEVAIRDHVEKFRDQNPDIRVHLELMQDKQALSDSIRLTLFRIYQQAIHNVARHSQATEVHIRFRWDEARIILEVEDNGIGFEVPENWVELVHHGYLGLLGIAERVESLLGKLDIVSALGEGTLIRANIPYSC